MDELKSLAVFAAVVRQGSMSAAARRLGLSASAVSQQVRALEQLHGVTLLHRSTRKLTLSDAGARVYAECAQMVDAAERAQRQLRTTRDEPTGELRLAAPIGFGPYMATALTPLLAAHPALSLRLLVDDAMIDLIDARIDLAIRVGRLPDSHWVAQRLCAMRLELCAAPGYLARHGEPRTPEELPGHHWLSQSGTATAARGLQLRRADGETRELHLTPRIASNNQLLLQQMCTAGLGIALIGSIDAHGDVAAGRLARVLPEWQLPAFDVWALTPQRDAQPAKVRHARAVLGDFLRALPGTEP
ncbi:MAG TPA: LysR family transcriptional regulator [Tahibacter sp.]|uniref:LysR family transcriptional regulator n=1 Tax=Tahibacter sp. TaxID=2056211 RepID=UPI002D18A9CD|nr:LysR family transcriptional regulator [Tahibacter sp.]HSX59907.1 LysR family transcriptional regulator [Tahibacter sp.]